MKIFNIFLALSLMLLCNGLCAQGPNGYALFGTSFEPKMGQSAQVGLEGLGANDSIPMQLQGQIVEVCQAKGCWMRVDLDQDAQIFVRFKDYGFFVPKDAASKTTILNGVAFVEEMSVEDQRHYAKDKGASDEELARITQPKKTYRFEADGVYIQD